MKKQLLFFIGFLICVVFASLKPTQVNPFRIYPYLQVYDNGKIQLTWFSNSLTSSSIKLVSATGAIMYQGAVEAEEVPDIYYTSQEKNQIITGLEQGSWIESDQVFRYRFLIDLPADVKVNYVVTLAGLNYSGTFTMPSSRSSWEKIRFIALADSETDPRGRVTNRAWYPGQPLVRPITTVPELWKQKFGNTVEQGIELPNYMLTEEVGYRENLKIVNSRNPNFIIMPGDLVQGAGYQPGWDEFFRQNAGLNGTGLSRYAIIPALGNWEAFGAVNGGYGSNEKGEFLPVLGRKRFHTYFETPTKDPLQKHRQSYNRVDYGPVTILTLDSSNGTPDQTAADFEGQTKLTGKQFTVPGTDTQENYILAQYNAAGGNDLSGFGPGSDQYIWLEENLKDARYNGQLIFVQYHHASYSSGEHGVPMNHELSVGQVGTPMRVINPMLEEYGVVAVFSGHDELFERSFVDEDNDGKGIMYYDVGVAGDGLRGEKRDWLGNPLNTLDYNPYRKWSADQSSAEVWNTSGTNPVLTDGGKHYGHLEVNLEKIVEGGQEFALVNFVPVYAFPVMDQNYNLQKVERRIYKDEVSLKIPLRKLEYVPEVKDSVSIYLENGGKAFLNSLDYLEEMPEAGEPFTFISSEGFEFDCEDLGLNEITIISKNTDTGQEWIDEVRVYVLDTIAPEFDVFTAYEDFDYVKGALELNAYMFDPMIISDNCSDNYKLEVEPKVITCADILPNTAFQVPVKIIISDKSGNKSVLPTKIQLNVLESTQVSLEARSDLFEGKSAEIALGDELEYEVLNWAKTGGSSINSTTKSIIISEPGEYYAVLKLESGCIASSKTVVISFRSEVEVPTVKEKVGLLLDEDGRVTLNPEKVFTLWPINSGLAISLSKTIFSCEELGQNLVTVKVSDSNGVVLEKEIVVIVEDPVFPILITKDHVVEFDVSTGILDLDPNDFVKSLTDNCGIKELTITNPTITCEDIGKDIYLELVALDQSRLGAVRLAKATILAINTRPVTISGSSKICLGENQPLTMTSQAAFEVVRWRRNGTEISGATGKTLEIDEAGSYHAIVRYVGGCLYETEKFVVEAAAKPSGEIVVDGNILRAPEGNYIYQWFRNGDKLIGDTQRTLTVNQMGEFSVELTNEAGCVTSLDAVTMTISGIFNPGILVSEELKIYPNPAFSEVKMQALGDLEFPGNSMRIYNSTGGEVSSSVEIVHQSTREVTLAISRLAAGSYVVIVESADSRMFVGKLVKR